MVLKIATEFSEVLGPRFRGEGFHSGEQFRDDLLRPRFDEAKEVGQRLLVDLDGAAGYPTSFLEEAFGGLARIYSPEKVLTVLLFKSDDEPYLKSDIERYIREAKQGTKATQRIADR